MPKDSRNRIYSIFEPEIELDEMSIQNDRSERNTQQAEDSLSKEYPMIKINSYIFHYREIEYLKIDSNDFLPTITVTIVSSNKEFLSRDFPKDGDILSVMIRHNTDILKPIRNDYIITGASSRKFNTNVQGTMITFYGELFVPGLRSYYPNTMTFEGTSMEIMKQIAKTLELGFSTNDSNTKDKQIWYVTDTYEDLIKDTTKKAWKDEDSFYECWIDIYYNLNFVNINKQLLSSEDEVDVAAMIGNLEKGWYWGEDTSEEATQETAKVFSDFEQMINSSFYIKSWKSVNKSTNITFKFGSNMVPGIFEHLQNLYEESNSKKYWNPEISPKYDSDKTDKYIILRGRPNYNPENEPDSQARANYNIPNIYKNNPWMGVQYTLNNPNSPISQRTGNHHKNYKRAIIHNTINLAELDKLNVHITVKGKNMNIIKGDKLPILIRRKDPLSIRATDPNMEQNVAVDSFYSGWYIVKGYNIIYSSPAGQQVDNSYSKFSQTFVLTRREWPAPLPIEKETV